MKKQEYGSHPQVEARGLWGNSVCMLCPSHLAPESLHYQKLSNLVVCSTHFILLCYISPDSDGKIKFPTKFFGSDINGSK